MYMHLKVFISSSMTWVQSSLDSQSYFYQLCHVIMYEFDAKVHDLSCTWLVALNKRLCVHIIFYFKFVHILKYFN